MKQNKEFPFNLIPYFIAFIALMVVGSILLQSWLAYEVLTSIKESGIDGAIHTTWCGETPTEDCTNKIDQLMKK